MNILQAMQFIKSFVINLLLIALFVYLVTVAANSWLSKYTRHGEALTLPDLKGMPVDEAIVTLEQKKLRYLVTDTVFADNMPKMSVVDQNPSANSKVKEGRIIYLTINANTGAVVIMPNLINNSLRYAETVITGSGLTVGNIIYKPDIAQNAVLDQLYNGKSVQPGSKVLKGSAIDLVVGDGSGGTPVSLPDLKGLNYDDAINIIKQSLLLPGAIVFDDGVTDTINAVVKRQNPPFTDGATVNSGTQVDLFLSK